METHETKRPEPDGGRLPGDQDYRMDVQHNTKRRLSKIDRVALHFVRGGSLNRFEAERGDLHDHCLPSTVASLQAKGITISRREEVVPGYCGHPTRVARYWIDPEHRTRALEVLQRDSGAREEVRDGQV